MTHEVAPSVFGAPGPVAAGIIDVLKLFDPF